MHKGPLENSPYVRDFSAWVRHLHHVLAYTTGENRRSSMAGKPSPMADVVQMNPQESGPS